MFQQCDRWLELGKVMRIHVSNVHRGLLGREITHVEGGHLGVVRGVPNETPRGPGGPPRSDAHASASPDIKTGACHLH